MSNSLLGMIAQGGTDPFQRIGTMVNTARGATALQQQRFDLQQAQLQPAYNILSSIQNVQGLTYDNIKTVLAQAARGGANVDGMIQNMAEMASQGMKPNDFARVYGMQGINPTAAFEGMQPRRDIMQTPYGPVSGTWGAPYGGAPAVFTPAGGGGGGGAVAAPAPGAAARGGNAPPIPVGTSGSLPDIVAQLESSGGAGAAANMRKNPTMVDPVFGQYPQFAGQYGTGAAGVMNYANQVLAKNPNATLGDFYSGYVMGTGDPGNLPGLDALRTTTMKGTEGAYNNLVNNAGVSPATPLASLVGSGAGTQPYRIASAGATWPVPSQGAAVQPAAWNFGTPPGAGVQPMSPYIQPQLEQSSKDFTAAQADYPNLAGRIGPLQTTIGLLQTHPDLATGPGTPEYYQWLTGLAANLGVEIGNKSDADAQAEIAKQLARNNVNMGANRSNMEQLTREASQPNINTQSKVALQTLAAEQIGYDRLQFAAYLQYKQLYPNGAAEMNPQFFHLVTSDWAGKLDPMAFAADYLPTARLASYVDGLRKTGNKPAWDRFNASLSDANRLFGVEPPTPQGGPGGGG